MAYNHKKRYECNISVAETTSGELCFIVEVKCKSGSWYPRLTFSKISDARKYRNELLNRRSIGDTAKRSGGNRMPFVSEYWNLWSGECRSGVSVGWKISQDQMARDHILPYIGQLAMDSVTPKNIRDLLRKLEEKGLGDQTRRHVFNLLSRIFGDAADADEYGLLEISPVRKKHRPSVRQKERTFLTPDESVRLLEVSRDHFLGPAIWLGLLAGLRPEAIHALRWEAVDFDKSQIHIKEAFKRKENTVRPYPKGKKSEFAPMPGVLAEELRALKEKKRASGRGFVAPGESGEMLNYRVLLYGLKNLCRRAGVKTVTPHELRHSYSELCIHFGDASVEDVRRLLHHKSLDATKRYIHRTEERLTKVASMLNQNLPSLRRSEHRLKLVSGSRMDT